MGENALLVSRTDEKCLYVPNLTYQFIVIETNGSFQIFFFKPRTLNQFRNRPKPRSRPEIIQDETYLNKVLTRSKLGLHQD